MLSCTTHGSPQMCVVQFSLFMPPIINRNSLRTTLRPPARSPPAAHEAVSAQRIDAPRWMRPSCLRTCGRCCLRCSVRRTPRLAQATWPVVKCGIKICCADTGVRRTRLALSSSCSKKQRARSRKYRGNREESRTEEGMTDRERGLVARFTRGFCWRLRSRRHRRRLRQRDRGPLLLLLLLLRRRWLHHRRFRHGLRQKVIRVLKYAGFKTCTVRSCTVTSFGR